jgi:hypothetical protein
LARAEKEAAMRAADETEAAAQQLRDVLKEERGAGAGGGGGGGKPLKGKTVVVVGGGEGKNSGLFIFFNFQAGREMGAP